MTNVNDASEERMSFVRGVFDQAANAIVQASELAKEVERVKTEFHDMVHKLQDQLTQMQAEIDRVQARNRELDNLLADVREQRDRARTELATTKDELTRVNRERETIGNDRDYLQRKVTSLSEDLAATQKERDDAQLRVMELEDKLKSTEASLDEVKSRVGAIMGMFGNAAKAEEVPSIPLSPVVTKDETASSPSDDGHSAGHGDSDPRPEPTQQETYWR